MGTEKSLDPGKPRVTIDFIPSPMERQERPGIFHTWRKVGPVPATGSAGAPSFLPEYGVARYPGSHAAGLQQRALHRQVVLRRKVLYPATLAQGASQVVEIRKITC